PESEAFFAAGSGRGSREPAPRTQATKMSAPRQATAPGNQSVGTKPSTSDGRLPSPRRTTASALLPPLAAYRRLPSGESASASTMQPKGSLASSLTSIRSTTENDSVSI